LKAPALSGDVGGAPGGHLDEQCALAALDKVQRDDPLFEAATARRSRALEAAGRDADAGAILAAAAGAHAIIAASAFRARYYRSQCISRD
jgi:hypothetical protein